MNTKNLDLELATFPQIIEEMKGRGLPFILITDYGNGYNIFHQDGIKAANIMKCLNFLVGQYLDYAEKQLED